MKHMSKIVWLLLVAITAACRMDTSPPLSLPPLVEIAALGPDISSIAFSPSATESGALLAVTTDSAVEFWTVTPISATQSSVVPYPQLTQVMPDAELRSEHRYSSAIVVAFSPDGATLAVGGTPDTCAFSKTPMQSTPCKRCVVYRWDLPHTQPLDAWNSNQDWDVNGGPRNLQFGADGQHLALLFNLNSFSDLRSEDYVAVWDTSSGKPVTRQMVGGGQKFLDLAFSPDGQLIAITSWVYPCFGFNSDYCPSREVVVETALIDPVRNSERGSITYTLPYSGVVRYSARLVFSPDGQSLVTALRGPGGGSPKMSTTRVYVHDTQTLQPRAQYDLTDLLARNLVFSPDGQVILIGDDAGRVHFLTFNDWREFDVFDTQLSALNTLALSSDGRLLAAVGEKGEARVWAMTLK